MWRTLGLSMDRLTCEFDPIHPMQVLVALATHVSWVSVCTDSLGQRLVGFAWLLDWLWAGSENDGASSASTYLGVTTYSVFFFWR